MIYQRNHQQLHYKFNNTGGQLMEQSTINFIYFLAVIGGVAFIIWISKILWALIKAILPSKNYRERYGEKTWAVVTGGSDGIGLAYCQQLASLGFNICMIARNRAKMQEALKKIKNIDQNLEIQTKFIVADFSQCQRPNFFEAIMNELRGLQISILVNNVGISNIGTFHEIPQKRLRNQIFVNILPMTLLTHFLLPELLKREKRSAIINLSSVAGQNPIPFISTYCATKAYNDFLSQALQMEYAHKIDILSVRPMYVATALSKMEKSCTVASAKECVQATLKYLGIDYETNGYYMHRFLSYTTQFLPKAILRCVAESQSRKIVQLEREKNK